MAVREFRDDKGRNWRAWDVRPDDLSPRTKDEDYLASLYYTGWIAFETTAGDEKRRLFPIPTDWSTLPDEELVTLLKRAEGVKVRAEGGGSRAEGTNKEGR
jgi:hypothetical protein